MRALLDECVPKRLKGELPGHQVSTVRQMGWAGRRNGELLSLMQADGFDVLITVDQNLPHQHNVSQADISVIILVARSNRFGDPLPAVPSLRLALASARPGGVIRVIA